MNLRKNIENELKKSLAEEGITQDLIDCVDLEIEYTPVLAIKGENISDAIEVIKTKNGYFVKHPFINKVINEDELKIMRCRYLLSR